MSDIMVFLKNAEGQGTGIEKREYWKYLGKNLIREF